ncbi:tRNA dihydrouridine(16) synthase DusC [Vibrio sp. V09_P4A23P171]|uniref:tRNA-dihydrouridine(16) synthase n=2 Tax=Vibrio TaxID=662 RepID=A0A853QV67_9VIBR|nr:tRNA-dihydrouridine synthase [Vibrio anguillarum 775]AGU57379.1 tRNA-dihydrouridine synthase C [Vibrio anguillarum M3]AVT67679.1 tRNA dihydrouridine(16) synthase DusC [Vibrio anguillarum]OEE32955.1 tRNA dihydrouridine(16) synthase DusC [Vibrio ordalii FS-238]OXX26238.1 tRNA dihydrouridine(16) synthase DusC [Vibrio sp. V05_P4A8T149]OXX27309.1 tRNA dihydrouridine(16) synthase DusC [Vibrio sp. V08_P9A1T1]OXX27405.1 tRNA dihydrouridine(16) synthase DusC [Vibrio sp. V06_P1A73T115]OXX30212.1 tR
MMMRVILGPMEGVLDHLMRELLTQMNDYDLCVTEFVRVVDQLLPDHVFYRLCPELKTGSKTQAGVPVHVQLLGQEPHWMAENAARVAELGAHGIDLNFGCPAKTVNKHKGGAALLQHPELIYQVVKSCRDAVPKAIPVSAKIRLGWEDPNDCFEIVDAIEQAGANELTVHARTKAGGYRASEIKWDYINQIRQKTSLPLIANGEIWNYDDGQACIKATGVESLMVCRGAFNVPNLGNVVKHNHKVMPWHEVVDLLLRYSQFEIRGDKGFYYPNRVKQWFTYLRQEYPQANELFREIRTFTKSEPIVEHIQRYRDRLQNTL